MIVSGYLSRKDWSALGQRPTRAAPRRIIPVRDEHPRFRSWIFIGIQVQPAVIPLGACPKAEEGWLVKSRGEGQGQGQIDHSWA